MKLSVKFIIVLEILILLSVGFVASHSYSIGTKNIEHQLKNQLESVVIIKSNQLNNFVEDIKNDIDHVNHHISQNILANDVNISLIRKTLNDYLLHNNDFFEFFILDEEGKVLVSTEPNNEGKIKTSETYFLEGKEHEFLQPFYYDTVTSKPALTMAEPIKKDETIDIVWGVLVGRINTSKISEIMAETSGLDSSGETYLVNQYNYAVTSLKEEKSLFSKAIFSSPIISCLENKPNTVQYSKGYLDYSDNPCVGSYIFLPYLDVCLIAEIDESEAFASMIAFQNGTWLITIILIISSLLIGFSISRKLTESINLLNEKTKDMSKGNLESKVNINSNDEIGRLAKSFEQMRISLRDTQNNLLDHQKNLESKVNQRTEELQDKILKLKQSEAANLNILSDLNENIKDLENAKQQIKKKNNELEEAKNRLEEFNKELEKKVDDRTQRIKELLKQKDEFIHQLGHDLKNPLGPLMNLIPIVEKNTKNKKYKKMLEVVMRNVNYMKNLVKKTLELAKLNSPNTKLNFEMFDLKSQVDQILNNNTYLFEQKKMDVINNISDELQVNADSLRIEELFTNLLNNAVKYSDEGGTITINTNQKSNEIQISVSDDGIGMTNEQIEHLFDEFYKADESRHDFDSSGLGMPIAKRIVEKHGGRIWVESKGLGEGSTFYFTLPKSNKDN